MKRAASDHSLSYRPQRLARRVDAELVAGERAVKHSPTGSSANAVARAISPLNGGNMTPINQISFQNQALLMSLLGRQQQDEKRQVEELR